MSQFNELAFAKQNHLFHIAAGATTNCLLKEANLQLIKLPSYEDSLVSLAMSFFRKSIGSSGLVTVLAVKLRAGFDAAHPMDTLILRRVLGGRLVESIENRMRAKIVHMLQNDRPVPTLWYNLQVVVCEFYNASVLNVSTLHPIMVSFAATRSRKGSPRLRRVQCVQSGRRLGF